VIPEALPHIFDLFRQADEEAPRSKSGLGIRLASVRNLVELHGGSLMKRKGAQGLGAVYQVSRCHWQANEEFTGMVKGLDRLAPAQSGCDPYEMWRTRVNGARRRDAGARASARVGER
jgi:hypothetical protein